MLSVARVFVLRGLAPPCPVLKGVFVALVFSGMGERLGCLRGGCQLSGILPCLANLWPRRVPEPQPACPTPASRVPLNQKDNDRYSQGEPPDCQVPLLSLSEQHKDWGGDHHCYFSRHEHSIETSFRHIYWHSAPTQAQTTVR